MDLALAVVGMVAAGSAVMAAGSRMASQTRAARPSLRVLLWSGVCGLVGYLFYGFGLPGSVILEGMEPGLRGLIIGLVCGLLPVIPVVWLTRGRGSGT
jgi:hypothetical protein